MGQLIAAIVLLFFSIRLAAYSASRQENRFRHLTVRHAVLLCVTFGFFIAGTILLFIATGWKWGLVGLGLSYLVMLFVMVYSTARTGGPRPANSLLLKRVQEIRTAEEQHKAELEHLWMATSPEETASLVVSFLDELRRNWTREYSQLNPERIPDALSQRYKDGIIGAYGAGYMRGKGWISQEHLVDYNIYMGDDLARDVRLVFNGARSNGNAFAIGYVAVAARGHMRALRQLSSEVNP